MRVYNSGRSGGIVWAVMRLLTSLRPEFDISHTVPFTFIYTHRKRLLGTQRS